MQHHVPANAPALPDRILSQTNPTLFQAGDLIEFEKSDGYRWWLTILGIAENNEYEVLFWDGRAHLRYVTEKVLSSLRIVRRDVMDATDVQSHRSYLGLNTQVAA